MPNTAGALVTASQQALLATVAQLDPIYVDLTQPISLLQQQRRDIASGALRRPSADLAVAWLILEDGSAYPHAGKIQFSEVIVDQGTGLVILRAVLPNPDQLLLPGMFVRVQVEEGVTDRALLVPQRAVSRTPRGERMAFVVDAEGVVEQRILRAGRAVGTDWLVTDGLQPGGPRGGGGRPAQLRRRPRQRHRAPRRAGRELRPAAWPASSSTARTSPGSWPSGS